MKNPVGASVRPSFKSESSAPLKSPYNIALEILKIAFTVTVTVTVGILFSITGVRFTTVTILDKSVKRRYLPNKRYFPVRVVISLSAFQLIGQKR